MNEQDIREFIARGFAAQKAVDAILAEPCIRCGAPLESEIAIQTGICADCWTPEDEEETDDE